MRFPRSDGGMALDGVGHRGTKVKSLRESYQIVVLETAELRAWGAEWICAMQSDVYRAEATQLAYRASLLDKMKSAEKMLDVGALTLFEEHAQSFPDALNQGRIRAIIGLRQSLARFETLERQFRRKLPSFDDLDDVAKDHAAEVGGGVGLFLGELNNVIAELEGLRLDERARMVRTTVEEIKDVNFRINLIAINASIEAARVGDAGRGFAHIAGEIRALSLKSREAFDGLLRRLRSSDLPK
jgi:methyl-accepting chemotaxis protein